MEPDTADLRCAEFLQHRQPNREPLDKTPPLLRVNHQSRQVCSPIYKNRFQIRRNKDLWETYILADHDILALSESGLVNLVSRCELREAQSDRDHLNHLSPSDRARWWGYIQLLSQRAPIDMEALRDELTPGIMNYLDACLRPPSLDRFRGDLAPIKRLILHRGRAEELWPGLYRDLELLATLDRILPVAADYTLDDWPSSKYAPRLAEAGVSPNVPDRYRGRLAPCTRHVNMGDRDQPSVCLTRTPLDLAQWLGALAGEFQLLGSSLPADIRVRGMAFVTSDWTRHLAACHEVAMHCFSEPRYRTEPLPGRAAAGPSQRGRACLLGVRQLPAGPRAGPVLADGNYLRLPPRGHEWVGF